MKTFIYNSGYYWIKGKGRGVIKTHLTKSQAKAIYELLFLKVLELEGIEPVNSNFPNTCNI